MNRMLIIQQATETRDAVGGTAETWSKFAQAWGSIESISGREVMIAAQLQSPISAKARIRYLVGLTTKMRISHDGKIYDINFIRDISDGHREMELLLTEGLKSA